MRHVLVGLVILAAVTVSTTTWADTIINTTAGSDVAHVTFNGPAAGLGLGYIGQSFTVPTTDTELASMTFYFDALDDPSMTAYIQPWDGGYQVLTGGVATWSDTFTVSDEDDTAFTFHPDKTLTPGGTYIAYFGTGPGDRIKYHSTTNPYGGGQLFGIDGAQLAGPGLQGGLWAFSANDAYFTMDFESPTNGSGGGTPELGTFALMGLSMLPMAGVAIRRRRKAA